MKKLLLAFVFLSAVAKAQIVTVPDATFKSLLLYKYDFNSNGKIEYSEVDTVRKLSVNSLPVADLTGIEAFIGLKELTVSVTQISSINLSMNTQLENLACLHNNLTTLDLSANPSLVNLDCTDNQLSVLDVSANTLLTGITCNDNYLTALDVSLNTELTGIDCINNQIASLNINNNTSLTFLRAWSNQLTFLDVRLNTALTYLGTGGNPNLAQICVNSYQYFNQIGGWGKDATTAWNNNCSVTTSIPELDENFNVGKIIKVYNLLGEEISLENAKEKEGVYFYYYNTGAVKKVSNFK